MRAPACGDHPELHPFPTRRSSDLAVIGGAFAYPVSADEPVPPKSTSRTIEVHGQIVRVLPDQIVVDTRDRRNVVVWLRPRSEEHTSELQSRFDLVCRLLLEKKKIY